MASTSSPNFHATPDERLSTLTQLGVFIAVMLVEFSLFILLLLGKAPLGLVLIGHSFVFGALAAVTVMDFERRKPLAELSIWTAIAGPFGVMLTGLGWLGRQSGKRKGGYDFNAWVEEDVSDEFEDGGVEQLVEAIKDNRIGLDTPKTLGSFTDYIANGEQDEQLNALRVIGANYGPDFAPALHAALVNQDAAVRVMAATILATLKKSYSDRLARLKSDCIGKDREIAPAINLAQAHIDFAKSGLLNADLADEQYELARKLLLDASEGSSQDDARRLAMLETIAANDSQGDDTQQRQARQDLRAG